MMKRFWKIFLTACFTAVVFMPLTAKAEKKTVDWNVVFTAAGEMEGNFDAQAVNDAVAGMQPGDQVTLQVSFNTEYAKPVEWYLKNDVIKSLEESTEAAKEHGGGAYTYKLTYTDQNTGKKYVLFDSDKVGGDDTTGGQGLHKATTSLKGWEFVGEHKEGGKGGLVTLVVGLDGETLGNRYQDTLADLELQLATWIPGSGSESESAESGEEADAPGNQNNPPDNQQYPRKSSGTSSSSNRVKTGDTAQSALWYIIAGAAGLILLFLALMSHRARREEAAAAEGPSAERRDRR